VSTAVPVPSYRPAVLILGIIGFGLVVGWLAQFVVPPQHGRARHGRDWGQAIVAGLVGSFVGGTIVSLIAGDGFRLRPSGLIGSFLGAVLVLLVWRWTTSRSAASGHGGR
jgi:uncharacterized membrane protein YeaQ/YmgE (transglycosylase-associated protein family)